MATAEAPKTQTPAAEKTEKKNVNVTVSLPVDLYEKLYNGVRFDLRLDRGPFGRHVFESFANSQVEAAQR